MEECYRGDDEDRHSGVKKCVWIILVQVTFHSLQLYTWEEYWLYNMVSASILGFQVVFVVYEEIQVWDYKVLT